MKRNSLIILAVAAVLVACHEEVYNTADRRMFKAFDSIMGQLCRIIIEECNKSESLDIEGTYLFRGDSLCISKLSDTEFKLKTEDGAESALDLTAELTGNIIWEYDNEEVNTFVVNGEGSCRISADSTLIYKISGLGIDLYHDVDYNRQDYTYFIYGSRGEIELTLSSSKEKQTYHYSNSGGRIRCRETGKLIRSYDD